MAKPIVDGLESDLKGRARVLRLNVMDSIGLSAARRFGVRAVPAFFVVNGQGGVVDAQIGLPDRAQLGAQMEALLAK